MVKKEKRTFIPFDQVVSALLDNSKPFSPTLLHRFSDIADEDLAELKAAWLNIDPNRRVAVLEDLEDLAEADTLVSFDDLAKFALQDPDARVRAVAIRLLWESDDRRLIPIFVRIMEKDADEVVRASAAAALGMFILIGELESNSNENRSNMQRTIFFWFIKAPIRPWYAGEPSESLGFSSREDIPDIIRKNHTRAITKNGSPALCLPWADRQTRCGKTQ